MKKISEFLLALIVSIMFISCASTNILDAEYDVQVKINGPEVADIAVIPTFSQDNVMVQGGFDISNNKGTYSYDIAIKNNTDDVLYVNWEKSAIYYNGISSYVLINNQSYFDRNDPMPSMMVPPRGITYRSVISADQPFYQPQVTFGPTWLIKVLPTFDTQLVLCVESSQGESFYIFTITGEEVQTI